MVVSRRAVEDYLRRDFDSFTWMKGLAREQILRELARFDVPPKFRREPWTHQLVCLFIALCMPRFLFLLDMGLGKTYLAALVIETLVREGRVRRGLVTVPRIANVASWGNDLAENSDLGFVGIDCEDIEEKRARLLHPPRDADVAVIDYQSLTLALTRRVKGTRGKKGRLERDDAAVRRLCDVYNLVNIDESHMLTNHESLWYSLLRGITKDAEFVYATTGTLFGKNVEHVWPQFFLVDRGETFGANMGLFRAAFFEEKATAWKVERRFLKHMSDPLHRMLQHRSIRYDESEVPEAEVPKSPPPIARRLDMTEEQREHYNRALEGLINAGGQLAALDGAWTRMRQICGGYLAWKDANGDHVVRFRRNPKLDELEALLEEMLPHSKVIVPYWYTESGRIVSERLDELKIKHEWFYGGSKDHAGQLRRFIERDECRVFLMQSSSAGTGVDGLQKVARYMVIYETPTDPTLRTQTIKRMRRPGQRHRTFVYDLVMRKSLEPGFLSDIADGIDTYQRVVNVRGRRGMFLAD